MKSMRKKKHLESNSVSSYAYNQNVIYCIQCKKCNMQYVGKTITSFKKRATAHRLSVNNAQKKQKGTSAGSENQSR